MIADGSLTSLTLRVTLFLPLVLRRYSCATLSTYLGKPTDLSHDTLAPGKNVVLARAVLSPGVGRVIWLRQSERMASNRADYADVCRSCVSDS